MHFMVCLRRSAGVLLSASALLSLTLACSPSKPTAATSSVSGGSGSCFLDSQKRGPNSVRLDGWAVGAQQEPPQSIEVKLEAATQSITQRSATLLTRADVADFFKNPKLNKTGFSIEVPSAGFPAGSQVSIISVGSSGPSVCKTRFTLK